MKVNKLGSAVQCDPDALPDQRFVHRHEDGTITAEYPDAFMPPAMNDLIHEALSRGVAAIDAHMLGQPDPE